VIWIQQWTDALFLHFEMQADELRGRLPKGVEIDTFDGQAWLSLVLFRLKLRPAGLPFVPFFSSLLELNVRTYIRHRGQAGICFLKMYANNRLAIHAARLLTPLDYEFAVMADHQSPDGSRHVECLPVALPGGGLSADVTCTETLCELRPGSLDFWLLERYRLFVGRPDGCLLTADVEHPPWRAAKVEAKTMRHSLCASLGLAMANGPALMHQSPGVAARFKAFEGVGAPEPVTAAVIRRPGRAVGLHGGR
jgi:uncharacterized protein